MKTKIFNTDKENLIEAADIIKNGGLVAIPTETVYGLAADGLNKKAIRKIFEAKNRPMDNPLILHISRIDEIHRLIKEIDKKHLEILSKLWPGPLTVILKKSEIIPDEISAGLDTVAIRMPRLDITRAFIYLCGTPLAAPSANLSTKPSPTNAQDVFEDMDGRIDAIIDGGASDIGIESTVLDLSQDIPKILRPGFYTKEYLEQYFEKIEIDNAILKEGEVPKSPGQKYKHYAPNAKVIVLMGDDDSFRKEVKNILSSQKNVGIMTFDNDRDQYDNENIIYMGSKNNLSTMAKILFKSFRKMDENGVELIVVRGVEEKGLGLSIMNRLKKAASNNIREI
ncbi:L-threonylcarbamoyladenylate synthase [Helcococcus sueciensis]|uniref:L-threonylcarbamoyladenylate synthase n=1 Tax=Helcococcus sueciensis TaxID=241555 RepID=UPI0003F7D5AA|nr:L-threonylcarbamoyladenylate synthase [Helcococcus sueciensis]